ncbi:hypothetical protein M405DRAFT_931065 [Rhizopogon salebrosus TDB-379]|nr:hypothetical protein M405DRAFT_931065 [Rhizopogon salebrosus TDB-379]
MHMLASSAFLETQAVFSSSSTPAKLQLDDSPVSADSSITIEPPPQSDGTEHPVPPSRNHWQHQKPTPAHSPASPKPVASLTPYSYAHKSHPRTRAKDRSSKNTLTNRGGEDGGSGGTPLRKFHEHVAAVKALA